MASLRPNPPEKSKSRAPAPTLFVGPPSRNASSQSLGLARDRPPSSSRTPISRQKSLLGEQRPRIDTTVSSSADGALSPFSRRPAAAQQQQLLQNNSQGSQARTEAKWAEMQNTLEEVELSATTGAHVFGSGHGKALEELRTAQIALAQAWARNEAEEELVEVGEAKKRGGDGGTQVTADVLGAEGVQMRERSGTEGSVKSLLEEETEYDIAMARRRREANDGYFRKVNAGVKDVVAKLEEVASAMKGIENESREIWGDKDSLEGSVA
jgi:hypothetical protein